MPDPGIDHALLCRIGVRLWGDNWPRQMAQEFSVEPRLGRRWASGERPFPIEHKPHLVQLMADRGEDLRALLAELTNGEGGA